MQRRLFILFLLLSFLPAVALLGVSWRMSQDALSMLDSPGLRAAMESSLELARDTLEGEKGRAESLADSIATELASPRALHVAAPAGGAYRWRGSKAEGDAELVAWLAEAEPPGGPRRLSIAEADFLFVASGELLLLLPLDAELAGLLCATAARHEPGHSAGGHRSPRSGAANEDLVTSITVHVARERDRLPGPISRRRSVQPEPAEPAAQVAE